MRQIPDAIACATDAVSLHLKVGNRAEEANARRILGLAAAAGGGPVHGRRHLREAIAVLDELHDARAADVRIELAAMEVA